MTCFAVGGLLELGMLVSLAVASRKRRTAAALDPVDTEAVARPLVGQPA